MGSRRVVCHADTWCGECYSNRKGRGNYKGHRWYRPPILRTFEGIEMALRKRDRAAVDAAVGAGPSGDALSKKLPFLWEFLTVTEYEDGSKRVLGTLIVFVDGPLVKAFINDRDQGLSACVSSSSLLGVLEATNGGLEADTLEWRAADKGKRRK